MPRPAYQLTVRQVGTIAVPGRYGDGRGLWLHVSPGLTKSWVFRYMLERRVRAMGLGPVDLVSLAEARRKAHAARKLLLDGIDPIEAREQERAQSRLEVARGLSLHPDHEDDASAHPIEIDLKPPAELDQREIEQNQPEAADNQEATKLFGAPPATVEKSR
jgi:Arm domain-containing DNA-binding protein